MKRNGWWNDWKVHWTNLKLLVYWTNLKKFNEIQKLNKIEKEVITEKKQQHNYIIILLNKYWFCFPGWNYQKTLFIVLTPKKLISFGKFCPKIRSSYCEVSSYHFDMLEFSHPIRSFKSFLFISHQTKRSKILCVFFQNLI